MMPGNTILSNSCAPDRGTGFQHSSCISSIGIGEQRRARLYGTMAALKPLSTIECCNVSGVSGGSHDGSLIQTKFYRKTVYKHYNLRVGFQYSSILFPVPASANNRVRLWGIMGRDGLMLLPYTYTIYLYKLPMVIYIVYTLYIH